MQDVVSYTFEEESEFIQQMGHRKELANCYVANYYNDYICRQRNCININKCAGIHERINKEIK